MQRIVTLLIAIGLSVSLLYAQVTISTPPKDGAWFKIRVVQTGKYLSVENASKESGARIVQWDYAGNSNQKFQAKKNEDGTYSFFAAHSGKSICADKGDNREGDLIIQNTLSQYFGKWLLVWMSNCGQGWKMQYKSGGGRPLQVTGVNNGDHCTLIEPLYHDGDTDCPYIYRFEPIDVPLIRQEEVIKSQLKPKPGVIKRGGN
jgi:Ricin-type beta-trefoil lectin domain-like